MRWLVDWWDSVELWVTQLAFPFQVALAIVVLLPLCWATAAVADRATEALATWWSRRTNKTGPGTGS